MIDGTGGDHIDQVIIFVLFVGTVLLITLLKGKTKQDQIFSNVSQFWEK